MQYNNRLFLHIEEHERLLFDSATPPDNFYLTDAMSIPEDFVLCRDSQGLATAIYGCDVWDFKPYRLAPNANCRMSFINSIKCRDPIFTRTLINDAKKIIFSLVYFVHAGVLGSLSVSTLLQYYQVTMKAAAFCVEIAQINPLLGQLSLSDLFSNKIYLGLYVQSLKKNKRLRQKLNALLNHLNAVGKKRLGYTIAIDFKAFETIEHKQVPVIPTRIYLEYINTLTERVVYLKSKTKNLEQFIKEFADPYFGLSKKAQRKQGCKKGELRPTMQKAVELFQVNELFSGSFLLRSRASLVGALSRIQYEMKLLIHLYTGMRNGEVYRLPYNCVVNHVLEESIDNEDGSVLTPSNIIDLLTTSTKFKGYLEEDTWYSHPIVLDAITVLQRIVRGYAVMVSLKPEQCPLFVSTVKILKKNHTDSERLEVPIFKPRAKQTIQNDPRFIISQEDYEVLQASDPERDFSKEESFQVGNSWPVTTHQFRRSLAFYAVNSGFISLPTLKKQFKHLSQEMTKYYSRNNENVKTVFGHFDTKSKQYVLPLNHIAYEIQVGMPLATAERLLMDLLDEENTLYGEAGGHLEIQKGVVCDGDVLVEEFKEETVRKVRNGEMSYRKTLLGGCTNVETCHCSILGEFADCLTSKCAVIKSNNINNLITTTRNELKSYDKNSVEYLATKEELEDLLRYRRTNIDGDS